MDGRRRGSGGCRRYGQRFCIPAWRSARPGADTLLGLHDPGQPWDKWGCPIDGCGQWFLGPGELEWHTAAEHLGGTATYQLLRPLPEPAPAGRVLALTRTQADAA